MDLDLNLNIEPQSDPGEDSHGATQLDRIRLLESVVSRGRHHRRPPPLPSQETTTTTTTTTNLVVPCKIDGGTHLLAKALAVDSSSEHNNPSTSASLIPFPSAFPRKPGGSVFDCNICYSLSTDPVVTCCGHIFCWPCFYCLPNSDSYYSKECPVCQGEVLETDVTPIYGGGGGGGEVDLLAGASSSSNDPIVIKIPPRPCARRIVSTRLRIGYPALSPLPPHQRVPQVFGVHPSWLPLATSNTVAVTSVIQPPRPSSVTEGTNNVVTVNSMASVFAPVPRTQTEVSVADAHSESPVTDRIEDSYAMGTRHSSSSSRRARDESSEIGFTLRNQRRRGDWLS